MLRWTYNWMVGPKRTKRRGHRPVNRRPELEDERLARAYRCKMQQTPPTAPPGRAGLASMRLRRSSAPFSGSQRNIIGGENGASDDSTTKTMLTRTGASVVRDDKGLRPASESSESVGGKEKQPEQEDHDRSSRSELAVFPVQPSKQDHNECMTMIVALQQNVLGLTACSHHDKKLNEHLKTQVQSLTADLTKAKEVYEEEKQKNEKISALRKQKPHGEYGGYLPDINSAAAVAAATAALQQQAQLEVTYQRKMLSLENRYKDLVENNKRLLRKIEQLEKTEADSDTLITSLRDDNVRLATQVDMLSSTVTSQSSLIIGLRTSLQKLNQDEHQIGTLMKKFDRSQIELEATRVREKLLREEHDRTKAFVAKEKESLMNKIVEFQQRLQQSTRAGDGVEALHDQIQRLEFEKRIVIDEMVELRETVSKSDTRMHEQESMTNRLLQENDTLLSEKRNLLKRVEELEGTVSGLTELEVKLGTLHQKESEIEELMHDLVDQQGQNDELQQTNAKLHLELQSIKQLQLSHDETVQALQLARQKAATHEALSLVNDEKQALEIKFAAKSSEWDSQRSQYVATIKQLEAETEFQTTRISQLQADVAVLRDRPVEQVIVQTVARPSTAEVEERARVEADLMRLHSEYDSLRENLENMEKEYNKLITKKYKTESFQSQVRLLQNENGELGSRIEDMLRDQEQDRAELHARATEIVELKSRVMDPQAIDLLRKTQESLEKTVSSLVEAEIASESTFTCLQCMRLFVCPMTLTPCGHTYCSSCLDKIGNASIPSSIVCKECAVSQAQETESVFPNQALADLTARFIFRQQTLSSLTTMCLSLRNSFANRSSA